MPSSAPNVDVIAPLRYPILFINRQKCANVGMSAIRPVAERSDQPLLERGPPGFECGGFRGGPTMSPAAMVPHDLKQLVVLLPQAV